MRTAAVFVTMLALGATAATAGARAREQGPIDIKDCQTIDQSGSYRLVNNLNATSDCLRITAQGVTIDLAGFAIVGNGTGAAIASPRTRPGTIPEARTVVRNGDISHFDEAVYVNGTVEGLRVTFSRKGLVVPVGIVRGNIVQFNSSVGISVADGPVTGNFVVGNGTGISVQEAAVITGNEVSGNEIGVDVTGSGSVLIDNVVDGNSKIGLRVACPSNVTNNTLVGNGTNLVLNGTTCRDENNVAP
jgi:parallel beta-helix repeat protein